MITYETGGIYFVVNLFKLNGSVFPKALGISLPSAFVCAGFVLLIHDWNMIESFKDPDSVMNNNAIWGGFSFLVGFLVVFRTSNAYGRFWEGCTQMHKMGAEWFDSCSSIVAFCKHSDADPADILRFQNLLVRLFSMLHAAALGEIEDCGSHKNYMEVKAFNMELIDAESVDPEALVAIRDCDAKVELIFQWIQQLVVENIKTGVLSIPAPILSRSFQEIAVGMVHFHEAMKISNVPFPFPYAQTCDCLLLLHWLLVPFISSQWVTKPWWAGIFSFIQVFTFWTLNLIAVELENPFGTDPNDIDGAQMQLEMNNHLRLLIRPETWKTPGLAKDCAQNSAKLTLKAHLMDDSDSTRVSRSMSTRMEEPKSTFYKIWRRIDYAEEAVRRYNRFNRRVSRMQRSSRRSVVSSLPVEMVDGSMAAVMRFSEDKPNNTDLLSNDLGLPRRLSHETKEVIDIKEMQYHESPGMHESHDEKLFNRRLGEVFDWVDSCIRPPESEGRWEGMQEVPGRQLVAISHWEGRWEDIQAGSTRQCVATPSEVHRTRPPSQWRGKLWRQRHESPRHNLNDLQKVVQTKEELCKGMDS